MIDLIPGKLYRRRDIHARLGGQQQGGISTPSRYPMILLFTGDQGAQFGYYDGFRSDGVFSYTGEGQRGDMTLTRGNRAIRNHVTDKKSLHLFEYIARGDVRYLGEGEYLGHRFVNGVDCDGTSRNVIVFELRILDSADGVPELLPDQALPTAGTLWRRSLSALRAEAYKTEKKPCRGEIEAKRLIHYRSDLIKVYVLRRSGGVCEGCGSPAPFVTTRGTAYLEPHHIRRRADGGPDHPQWVIALCPNCHMRVHHGADGADYNRFLAKRLPEIESAPLAARKIVEANHSHE